MLLLWLVVVVVVEEVVEVNGRWRQLQAARKSLHRSLEIVAAVAAVDDLVAAVVVVEQLVVAVEALAWPGLALVLAVHRACMSGKFVDAGTRI